MNNQSNLKRSYIEMADAADHLSSPINHFHSSSSNDMVEPQTAMADDACIQPQPQLQQQQQRQHIALPPLVEDLLNQLCNERKQPQPNYDVRRRLGLLGEEKALQLLHEINKAKVIKTLSGFIMWMIRNKPQYQCPSPSKYCPASLLQTQLSASPFTPSVHKEQPLRDHGGLRPRYSYSSASPSKALRVSPYQGPSYAPPSTITPVQLFKDALHLPQPFTQEMLAGWFSQPCSEIEDRIFRHCPCSLAFQQEKEKKKTQAKADTTEKENPPADVIERENSAKSVDANSGRGEKRPNAPIQGDAPADNIMPLQTFIRPRKVLRNLSPQGSPRPAEHPSSSHSVRAVQLATTSSAVPISLYLCILSFINFEGQKTHHYAQKCRKLNLPHLRRELGRKPWLQWARTS
ncbi:PREDICTED: probable RNA-dependent [Prunus dulcis]|uniref:PREDICTED: probable RNA-dependent n=1 Tax=Prunus dulcis TaxID=3755 RepID=A0A5E4E686_PRUDU|nr:PREDICTED: probable RNA-dependent [Prunus dulcis]